MTHFLTIAKKPFFLFLVSFNFIFAVAQKTSYIKSNTQAQKKVVELKKPDVDSIYQKKKWISPLRDTLHYRLLLPENFNPNHSYPLVLFLHGAGERGSDNTKQLTHGAQLFLQPEIRKTYPAIIVFPQCPENDYWSNVLITTNDNTQKREFNFLEEGEPTPVMKNLMNWLPALETEFKINTRQRYILGLSMGGMGTFELVRRKPGYFAAAIPICGGANPKTAAALKETSFWIFHGKMDDVVPYQFSENMFIALKDIFVGAEASLTLYSTLKHNSWDKTFTEPELLPWLFSQKK